METKLCSRCGIEKLLSEFHSEKTSRDGRRSECRICRNLYRKKLYRENPERNKIKNFEHYWRHHQKIIKIKQTKEEKAIKILDWRKRNKEKLKKYYERKKAEGHFRKMAKKWRENPRNRISNSISARISEFINKKRKSWRVMLPYSLEQLCSHLENQFNDKMSWDNYGSYWHIDHIKPICSFNFLTYEDKEFQECWSLNNLRPLEARENIRKGRKII